MSKARAKRKRRRRERAAASQPDRARAAEVAGGAGARASRAAGAGARDGGATAKAKRSAGPRGAARPARFDVRDGVARPRPPWAPFPLTEIGMAAGIIIFGAGFASASAKMLSIGALLLAVVTGELCLREHFAGFRSHALLLAALAVVTLHTVVVLALTDAYRGPVTLAIDLALGGPLAWWLHGRFRAAHERAHPA